MNDLHERLARRAFAGYRGRVGGTTYDDKPIPSWDELGERQQDGWRAAVSAIFDGRITAEMLAEQPAPEAE